MCQCVELAKRGIRAWRLLSVRDGDLLRDLETGTSGFRILLGDDDVPQVNELMQLGGEHQKQKDY